MASNVERRPVVVLLVARLLPRRRSVYSVNGDAKAWSTISRTRLDSCSSKPDFQSLEGDDNMPGNSIVLDWKDVGPGLLLENFLDPPARDAVLTDARAAAGASATVHGHGRTEALTR